MASLKRGQLLVKQLTPADVGRALAEFVAVRAGLDIDARCRVKTDYFFDRGRKRFHAARVEVEVV